MSSRLLLLLLAFLGPTPRSNAGPKRPPALPAAHKPLVLVNVTVIDVRAGKALPNRLVVIEDGRIKAVRPPCMGRDFPAGADVVQARGKFLIPGLWDMHAHITHKEFRSMCLAAGVTGVRHMFSLNPWYSPRRWNIQSGRDGIPGPRVIAGERLIDGRGSALGFPASRSVLSVNTEAEAREGVRQLKKRGEDFVKVYSALSRTAYAAAADEARKQGIDLVGHVPLTVRVLEASAAGQRSIEHMNNLTLACSSREEQLLAELAAAERAGRLDSADAVGGWRFRMRAMTSHDEKKAAVLFRFLAKNRTWLTPTLLTQSSYGRLANPARSNDPRWRRLPPFVRKTWEAKQVNGGLHFELLGLKVSATDLASDRRLVPHEAKLAVAAHRAGVGLLAGADSPFPGCLPGFGVHDELALLVEAGLTPAEALRTATWNPVRFFGWEADLGTVEKGKLADLVLLDANPLEKIDHVRKIAAVIVAGNLASCERLPDLAKGVRK